MTDNRDRRDCIYCANEYVNLKRHRDDVFFCPSCVAALTGIRKDNYTTQWAKAPDRMDELAAGHQPGTPWPEGFPIAKNS